MQKIKTAIEKTKLQFPFEGYLNSTHIMECVTIFKTISKFIKEPQNKRLLSIGSGPMDKEGVFQNLGLNCYAVDDLSDPWHLRNNNSEKIKKYAKKIGIDFHHQKIGDYHIPFKKDSFDVVCSLAVIEHLHQSPMNFLNTMGEFAKPGGLILITMPNSVNLRKRLSVLFGKTNYVKIRPFFFSGDVYRGHVREYTLDETISICKYSNFEILYGNTFESLSAAKLKPPFRQIYNGFGNIFKTLRSSIIVVAKKPENWLPAKYDENIYREVLKDTVPKAVH